MKLPKLFSRAEIFDRPAQDDLLQIRNDLMTVFREISAEDDRLFPLRYARTPPRPTAVPEDKGTAPPQVPVLVIPDGPGQASVLPYHWMRRSLTARGLDVLMMEHRGVGLSRLDARGEDLPLHAMQLREVLADLVAVLDHARLDRVSVYGVGYGAYLAQALAVLHPERVHSLVLDSPRTSSRDEVVSQRALRAMYWDGEVAATSSTAAALRRLAEAGTLDPYRAGPVVLAVHEHGGPSAVRDLVDLLVMGRGQLTWSSVRQALTQGWLQNTPYVTELDLTAAITHTELGAGAHADGGPLDPLIFAAEQALSVPAFTGETLDLHALAPAITAPTVVVAGATDLITPPSIARDLAHRIPGAELIEVPGAGHGVLDARSAIAQVIMRWAASGALHALPRYAGDLVALPGLASDRPLMHGLRIALAAERLSPWRLWIESARQKRERALIDPTARRARMVRID